MRRLTGLGVLAVLALVLVACGGDSGDDEPTATIEPTSEVVATIAEPTTLVVPPSSSPAASPAVATPVETTNSTPAATPAIATPFATPLATPVEQVGAVPAGASSETQTLVGTVLLPGTANERFVISDDGCIGLGEYAGLQAGQQVIVRDERGTVIGTANLAASNSTVVCNWTFEIEVPVSGYYEVSIPMRAEQVYAAADVVASNGQIELTLP